MLQLMKPPRTTPPGPEVAEGTGGSSGTSRRGDATYAQTDYLSHKSVMSVNVSSELGAKISNGGEASSSQDCQGQGQTQTQNSHHKHGGVPTSTATMQQQQHNFYYDQTQMGSGGKLTVQPPPSAVTSSGHDPRPGGDTSGEFTSPLTGLNNLANFNTNSSVRQGEQKRGNQTLSDLSQELAAARKEQHQLPVTSGAHGGAAGQKDFYDYRGETSKSYPLTVPQYSFSKDRSENSVHSLSSSPCPPSYASCAPKQQTLPTDTTPNTDVTSLASKAAYEAFHSSMNKGDVEPIDIKPEIVSNNHDVVPQTNLVKISPERTQSSDKNGDEAPATHSDSGIVHDGGSNTSSNSGSSGDHEDSATGSKAQSPPRDYPLNEQRPSSPGSPGESSNHKANNSALSSPFLTAAMTGASSGSMTSPSSSSMAEMRDRLSGDVGMMKSYYGPMSPFSHAAASTQSSIIPRPNMHPGNPLGLSFMSPGGSNMSGSMTPPRAPLTPGSARSMSPPEIPPIIEGGKEVYFCHLCSYVGNSKFHFNQHMNSHFEHRCPHCDYTSRTEGRLKRHIKDFHSEVPPDNYSGTRTQRAVAPRPKVYKCKQCEFSSVTKIDFWEHSRSHIKDDKVLQCPKCPFVTEYKHHLEYHLRNHFGSKPFKCPKCNYACVNKSMLNSHMKSHTNVYQYRCSDCTYATKYCHSLKLHLKKYNHKPATVLNPDGSLPTDGSGDFELVSKRGPPRGPRGPRKDQPISTSQPSMVNPMVMPQMTGMNGLHPSGMMPGYWPMIPPMPNGSMHPPPPLIPVSGAHMNPFNPAGLPSHMQQPAFSPRDERDLNDHSPGYMGGPGGPGSASGGPPRSSSGEEGYSGSESASKKAQQPPSIKCVLCDFKAEHRTNLNEHMLKVHAAENQDILNVFCAQPESLSDERSSVTSKANSDGANKPELSETAATPIKQEDTSSNGQSSPPPANQAWIMNTNQPGARKSTPGETFPSPMFRSTPQGIPTPQHLDMLQHQLLKERYNAAIAAEIAQNIEAEAKQNGESPLDLTKRKEQFQQQLAAHHMFFNPGLMMPHLHQLQKRKFEEMSMAAAMAAAAAGGQDNNNQSPPPSESHTPRKRSRKGKAYKLDTICQKLQERYGDSPSPPGGNCDSNDGDTSDGGHMNTAGGPQSAAPSGGDENEEQIDYSAIHRSLSELNSQMAVDSYRGSPLEGSIINKQLNTTTETEENKMDNSPFSSSSASQQPATMNRRKLFMVRHHEQLQQQQKQMAREMNSGENRLQQLQQQQQKQQQLGRFDSEEDQSARLTEESPNDNDRSSSPPYECSHCAISFRDCIMYTVHMGYHGYQDPFKCNMCGHASQNRVEFFLHIARVAHE